MDWKERGGKDRLIELERTAENKMQPADCERMKRALKSPWDIIIKRVTSVIILLFHLSRKSCLPVTKTWARRATA